MCLAPLLPAGEDDRLAHLDGRIVKTRIEAIDADGSVRLAGGNAVALQGLTAIERPIKPAPAKDARIRVVALDGSAIEATRVAIADGACAIDWLGGKDLRLPLSQVRSVRFPPAPGADAALAAQVDAALAAAATDQDALHVVTPEGVRSVGGALDGADDQEVRFTWSGERRTVARAKVAALTLARTTEPPDALGRCRVQLADGSALWGALAGLAGPRLRLSLAGGGAAELPWAQVARIDVRSDRLLHLSDTDPIEVEERSLVGLDGPWQRDRSVLGLPLTLAGQVHAKGIGVHPYSRLVWRVDPRFTVFAATIGIDDASRGGHGDCEFVVVADGRELARHRQKAGQPPRRLRVPLAEVNRLELIVEPGEGLDLGDHADWAEARLERGEGAKP